MLEEGLPVSPPNVNKLLDYKGYSSSIFVESAPLFAVLLPTFEDCLASSFIAGLANITSAGEFDKLVYGSPPNSGFENGFLELKSICKCSY